jgi:tetratricopeptide (TPR) repeat protein
MKNVMLLLLINLVGFLPYNHAQNYGDWLSMGHSSLKVANYEQALTSYNFHIENFPQDPMGYIYRARLYKTIGRHTESRMDMDVAKRMNPYALMIVDHSLRSRYSAKKIYEFNFKNLDDAFIKSPSRLEDYNKAMSLFDMNSPQDSLVKLIIENLNKLNLDEAERNLNLLQLDDINSALQYDLFGKLNMKKNDYALAIEYFTMAIDESPSFSIAYHNRSICYKILGEYEKAKQDLKMAIDLNENISVFFFTQAKLLEKLGDLEGAQTSYEEALQIDENYQEALINYSQLLKGLGEYSEGLKYMNLATPENEVEASFLEANLNFIYGEYEKAISGYNDYLSLYEEDSAALFNRGLSKILLRNNSEGCIDLDQSLELEAPENHKKIYEMFCKQDAWIKLN